MKLFQSAMLSAALGAASLLGCSNPPAPNDVQNGTDASDGGSDPDAMCTQPSGDAGNCFRVNRCDNMPFCPAQITNDNARPNFLITQIDVTRPPSLVSTGAVGMLLNGGLVNGTVFWGIALDTTAMTVRTGSMQQNVTAMPGLGFLSSNFNFTMGMAPAPGMPNRWDPVMGTITLTGDTFTTNTIASIRIPLFNEDRSTVLAELPFRNAVMHDVRMTSMRNCIGLAKPQYNSCLSNNRWNTRDTASPPVPAGVIEGDLSVADATAVMIPSLMTNLCNVIAGTDCTMPQAMWRNQPDSMVDGATTPNAWRIVGNFTAVGVRIQ